MLRNRLRKLPDTRLLGVMTRAQLIIVWRDVIYCIKNTRENEAYALEQYYAYLLFVYAYLLREGVEPNTKYIPTLIKGSFTYLRGFNRWVNTHMVMFYLKHQHMCNDGDTKFHRNYMESIKDKDDALKIDYEDALKITNERNVNETLKNITMSIFRHNDFEHEVVKEKWEKQQS